MLNVPVPRFSPLFFRGKVCVRANYRTIFRFPQRFTIRKYRELISIWVDNLARFVGERDFFQPVRVMFFRLHGNKLRCRQEEGEEG